ncbi:MAG TPA: TonB-dependent receptor [Gemmatimonadaceae bacterium]
MAFVLRAASLALLTSFAAASAQQSDTAQTSRDSVRTFDPVIVTAARRDERRSTAVISTAVISQDEIRRVGATDVAAALVQQLGLQVGGGTPAGSQVLIQGVGDQRVLVLLDGQPVTGRIGGAFDLSRLPTSIVERIEVVKGPQSVLYGTDAMGGVINIITRRPGPGAHKLAPPEASFIAGSHGRFDVATRVAGNASSELSYGVDVGRNHIDLAPGIASNVGAFANRWNVAPRLTWKATPSLSFDVGGLGIDESQRYRTGQLYTFSDNTQLAAHATAAWSHGVTRVTPTLAFSGFDHLSRAATTARPASDSGAKDTQRLLTATLAYSSLLGGLVMDAGTELRHESIVADRVPGTRSTDAAAIYAQTTWLSRYVSLAPGARLAWSEQWGTNLTPRLAAISHPLGDGSLLTLRASVARGFRAPDFKELYLRFVNSAAGYAVSGNDALRPEHSVNTTAEIEWTGSAVDLRASAFQNRIRNLIETIGPDATGTYTYDNVGRAVTAGGELEAARRWSRAELVAGYAYLHARDVATDGPILGRAAHSARATLRAETWSNVRLALTALHTGAAPSARDTTGNVSAERGALTQLNVRVARAFSVPGSSRVEASVGVDDLFDARRGLEWPGFTGRQLSVGLAWPAR